MPLSANHKSDEKTASETRIFRSPEDREVQALFAEEDRIAKEKLQLRQDKQRLKNDAAMNTAQDKETMQKNESPAKSSSTNPRTPQVYNGPCVICLEPDPDSGEKLQALGYLLQHTLPPWA